MTKKMGPASPRRSAVRILVSGVVQGVGFRPFIFRLAQKFAYAGWVKNTGAGVEIHLESREDGDFSAFLESLKKEKPPLSRIEDVRLRPARYENHGEFRILKSQAGGSFVFISPDVAACSSCLQEIRDPCQRRFEYPFTNCTDCGPRYTIVEALPYDRKQTTMAGFSMCAECRREYSDPMDRRYHAQPIACPDCGPRVSLRDARTGRLMEGGIERTAAMIRQGRILAVKGLGGFHLVCDPWNSRAIARLRAIKKRTVKPLALMARDLETVEEFADLSRAERREILSPSRPIILLKKKKDIPGIAPHLDEMGFMLAYTPLHALLLQDLKLIVATSSNEKDAPIIKDESEGIAGLCDAYLTHDRPIKMRADDSVMKLAGDRPLFLRRARGYVPYPQEVPEELAGPSHILALGGELKDTVSFYKNGYVVTSQFLGDLDDYRNFRYFEETISHLAGLFGVSPQTVVSDLHPDFRTTAFGRDSRLPHLQVQHHYAHVLAALLEHRVPMKKKVLGVSFDGFGYGEDGGAWGGEFLVADYNSWFRMAHFAEVPLPGGDLAARQPWRMALSHLREAYGSDLPRIPSLRSLGQSRVRNVLAIMEGGLNSPLTSSCGRLFDAVSFLAGLAPREVEFEAEAPMRLEAAARDGLRSSYPFSIGGNSHPFRVSFRPAIREIVADLGRRVPPEVISSKFHNMLGRLIAAMAEKARAGFGLDTVVLVGGVFLNKRLLLAAERLLEKKGFRVIRPVLYSPNDESLSLGQIAFALAKSAREKKKRAG